MITFDVGVVLAFSLTILSLVLSSRLKIHYTLILVISGLCMAIIRYYSGAKPPEFTGELILGLVLPTLVFQAALSLDFQAFNRVKKRVFLLAIVGVVISALVSTSLLVVLTPLTLLAALAFGVIISPTDAASVIDTFKRLGVPHGLSTLVEGEALLNDATAIVLFSAVTSLMLSPILNVIRFTAVFGGGIMVGLVVAFVATRVRRLASGSTYQVVLSMAVAYGAYATAQALEFSGVVAVAITGLLMSRTFQMNAESTERLSFFWEIAAFMANASAFLFLGLVADISMVLKYAALIVACFVVVLAARFASVYSVFGLASKIEKKTPQRWQLITALGGMRGAISVALALALPAGFPKDLIVTLTFGVALISLLIQGSVLQTYVRKHVLEPNAI